MLRNKFKTTTLIASMAVAGLTMPVIAAPNDTAPKTDQNKQQQLSSEQDRANTKTLEGRVVNLRTMLTDSSHKSADHASHADQTRKSERDMGNHDANEKRYGTKTADKQYGDKTADRSYGSQSDADSNAPLGIFVEEEGTFGSLTASETAYLILHNPDSQEQQDAYEKARDMIGKQVKITGRVVEEASINGIVIEQIQPSSQADASSDDKREDSLSKRQSDESKKSDAEEGSNSSVMNW